MNAHKMWSKDMLDQIVDVFCLTRPGQTYHIPYLVSNGVPPVPFTSLPVSEASVVDPMTYKVVTRRGC